jgi:Domain of unknown function (DUF1708)
MKWCWSRLPGGVVTWDAYELFKIGESGKQATAWILILPVELANHHYQILT